MTSIKVDDMDKKLFDDATKQIKSLNKDVNEQKKIINKQRTEISQLRAQQNRTRSYNVSDNKQLFNLKKDKQKADRTVSDLRQKVVELEKRLSAMTSRSGRSRRSDKLQTEENLEQLVVQQRRLDKKLKQLREKEAELIHAERKQAVQKKDLKSRQTKMSLQQQQEQDAAEKDLIVKKQE